MRPRTPPAARVARPRTRATAWWLCLALALLAPPAAEGQATRRAIASYLIGSGPSQLGGTACGTSDAPLFGPDPFDFACTDALARWAGGTSARDGVLRTRASVAFDARPSSDFADRALTLSAITRATWEDRLLIRGPVVPAYTVLTVRWTGDVAAAMPNDEPGQFAQGYGELAIRDLGTGRTVVLADTAQAGATRFSRFPSSDADVVLAQRAVRLPIVNGASPFELLLSSWAYLAYDAATGVQYPAGSASVDLGRTARVVGVAFLDADGRPIAGPVDYVFANGLQVTPVTAPEPATLALVGGGLLALAAGRLGRRRR